MKPIRIILLAIAVAVTVSFAATAAEGPDRSARKYYKKGVEAYEKTDLEEARKQLQSAIESYPAYAEAYYTLGQVSLAENKVQQATGFFTKAAEIDPGHTDAQLALGRILMAARAPEEALVRTEMVLKKNPGNLAATTIKASALLARKRDKEAVALLGPLFDAGQRDRDLVLLLAGACFSQGQAARAESVLKAGIETHPKEIPLHLQLAAADLRAGDLQSAQAVMETVVGIDPENAAHAITLARLYWETGDMDKVDACLVRALKADPADPSRKVAVANFYLEKNKAERAEDLLIRGIADGDAGAGLRLALGELYLKTGKAQAAVDLLKQGLEATPEPTDSQRAGLQNALARIFLSAGDTATAITYAKAVLDVDPVNLQALVTHGMALKTAGQPDAAVPDFKQVLRRQPDFLEGYLQLADAYAMRQAYGHARETLATGIARAPDNRDLRLAMVRVCLMDKDYKQAEQHLQAVVERHPDDIAAQAKLGDFYLTLNDVPAARREYSEILLKSPRSAIGYIKLARLYSRQGQTDSAIDQLNKGLARVEQDRDLAAELVGQLLAIERYDDALALCDARLAGDPGEAFAHDLKGKVFTKMKKYKEAQKSLEKAAEIDPMWPQAGNDLAALYLLQDKKEQAIERFEATLARNPKNPTAYLILGHLYEERSEPAKAVAVYEKAVAQVPGFWSAANRLAFLLADQAISLETLDRAMQLATAAYRMKPGQAAIVDTLGWIHYKKGETGKALQLYEQLIAAAPDDPVINYHMGVVLEKSGDVETAKERLQTATRVQTAFPGREHAEALLKALASKS